MNEASGEMMDRLCQLRDEMRRTPAGRAALAEVTAEVEEMADSRLVGGVFLAQAMELERVKAERDAAVADLCQAAKSYGFCDYCDNVREHKDTDMDHRCKTCWRKENYQWRGVKQT